MPTPIILLNDTTSHGGQVISAQSGLTLEGKAIACVGDNVRCPLCNGDFPIQASSGTVKYQGKEIACQGMKTACGAVLLASQQKVSA